MTITRNAVRLGCVLATDYRLQANNQQHIQKNTEEGAGSAEMLDHFQVLRLIPAYPQILTIRGQCLTSTIS